MNDLSNLQALVQAEIKRRTDAEASGFAPERVVLDGSPDDDAKLVAAEAAHPGKTIVVRRIFESTARHADTPEVELAPARAGDDVIERARTRISAMKGTAT